MFSAFFMLSLATEPQNQPPKIAICETDKTIFSGFIGGGIGILAILTYPSYLVSCKLCKWFPRFDFFDPKKLTICSVVATILPNIPSFLESRRNLIAHAEIIKGALRESYGSDLSIAIFPHNPFRRTDVISNSSWGIFVPYALFIRQLNKGAVLFNAAGNDGRPISSSCFLINQSNQNPSGLFWARICKRFNIWGYREKECQEHKNTIHCGVVSRDELGLESYSNYPAEGSSLRFLTIVLPEGSTGTSFAAPIIAGIFCKLKSMYPQIPNRELIDLMYETAKYIGNGNATQVLASFYEQEISKIRITENNTLNLSQDLVDRLILELRGRYTPDASSRCEHERLIHRFTNSGNQLDVMAPLICQIYNHPWGNHFTPQGTLKPAFYIVNREQLFSRAVELWGTATEQTTHNTVSQAA